MSRFIIEGGKPLQGEFPVAGMKNAATPITAAALLLARPITLHNVPDILDVERMMILLQDLGAVVNRSGSSVTIDSSNLATGVLQKEVIKRLRSSVLLIGPMLARFGKVRFPMPGGCYIGNRPIDTHLDAFRQLGIAVSQINDNEYELQKSHPSAERIVLSEFSVTATENAILFASAQDATVRISMAACEPHVQDLCHMLVKAGARIGGIGTHELTISGTTKLALDEWTIIPDQIEIGTMIVAAAANKGDIDIAPVVPEQLDAILLKCRSIGVPYSFNKNHLRVQHADSYKHFSLQALPYPGFPTDLQAPMSILATQAAGLSLIHDPMYDGRFSYIQELVRMGAQAVICDPHRVLISGPVKLHGERIKSFDLRAGATLILAGLSAQGQTIIEDADIVDRGYEHFDVRLANLGAAIKRQD